LTDAGITLCGMAGREIHRDRAAPSDDRLNPLSSPRTADLIGWLLRTNRLYATTVDFSRA
jgi:hypothetical protein